MSQEEFNQLVAARSEMISSDRIFGAGEHDGGTDDIRYIFEGERGVANASIKNMSEGEMLGAV